MQKKWDRYFLKVCEAVASKSSCHSRQIGAILVKDKSIVATGYNGPPRGAPHCGTERYKRDPKLYQLFAEANIDPKSIDLERCPRRLLSYESGQGLHLCIAAHAERNCIANAARIGASTIGSILYLNAPCPCKDCAAEIINAGVIEVVHLPTENYDTYGAWLLGVCGIRTKEFYIDSQEVAK